MRSLISLLAPLLAAAAPLPYFTVLSETPGAWPQILGSIGLKARTASPDTRVFVLPEGTAGSAEWVSRVESGAILVVEGESSMAELFGFRRGKVNIRAGSITDVHAPRLPIVWEQAVEMPRFEAPPGAQVFARERWTGAPMLAGLRRGAGAVLWVALPPGERGYERFPYLLHALADLGLEAPFRASPPVGVLRLLLPDARRRGVLRGALAAGRHRGASRGRLALLRAGRRARPLPAQTDRGLPPARNPGLRVAGTAAREREVLERPSRMAREDRGAPGRAPGLAQAHEPEQPRVLPRGRRRGGRLVRRFDWDGVNLAELYFESLEGVGNPSRFTPMNDDVRERFRRERGWDPIEIFKSRTDTGSRRAFLDFRAELARRMQEDWLAEIERLRQEKPHLDVVLTHVDDRFDTGMRDAIGADAARVLPLLEKQSVHVPD